MGFLDPGKILVVLVLALLVLGPERLPRAARQAGTAWRELTRIKEQVTDEIRSALPEDMPSIPRMPNNMVSGFLSDLTKPSSATQGSGPGAPGPGAAGEGPVSRPAANGAPGSPARPGPSRTSSWGATRQAGGAAQAGRAAAGRVPPATGASAPVLDDPSMN